MYRQKTIVSVLSFGVAVLLGWTAFSQRPGRPGRRGGGGEASLAQPFKGITNQGKIQEGLFKVQSTGVSTQPVVDAAKAFLAGLSPEQRSKTRFPVDDLEWRKWDNRHFYVRQGVGFDEMDETQRELAFALMSKSLSAKGLQLSKDIMKLNGTLAELANNFDEYGEWLYWITIMGDPSTSEPWGWQIDGHHLIVNYFVMGDQVVMSPVFVGSEPVHATSGKFKGTIVLQDEQKAGLDFMQTLDDAQKAKAIVSAAKTGNNAVSQAYKDNINLDYAGLKCDQLNEQQRAALLNVVSQFVGNMNDGHAKVKMDEVKEHLSDTWFAWVGGTTDQDVYYYRVHSPVILIEFDHERRVAPFRSQTPSRDHIHAVLRTPNGNDYGKDLLRQHVEHHHSHDHSHSHGKATEAAK